MWRSEQCPDGECSFGEKKSLGGQDSMMPFGVDARSSVKPGPEL